jgi:hypothetical protein
MREGGDEKIITRYVLLKKKPETEILKYILEKSRRKCKNRVTNKIGR